MLKTGQLCASLPSIIDNMTLNNVDAQQNGQLLESEHGQKVRTIVEQPAELWETLCHHTEEKGRKLRQAVAQLTLNRSLVDARTKLEELEVALTSEDSGSDLRTVKQMLKKHQNVSAFVIKTGSTTQWQADLAPKEIAASDMRNRCHVQPLLILEPLQGTISRAS
ncbi:SPTBN5 [Cordylochernes scorpioides]|uniref:SPTBN5 n=1 Tax=Cordylochernes scorpioides TaxID=51811 RepID=A0ABY6JYF5_9ARAC|nr:SPTBN5 [Cordylochernes scorpioides]